MEYKPEFFRFFQFIHLLGKKQAKNLWDQICFPLTFVVILFRSPRMLLFHFYALFHGGCYGHYVTDITHLSAVFLTNEVSWNKIMKAEMIPWMNQKSSRSDITSRLKSCSRQEKKDIFVTDIKKWAHRFQPVKSLKVLTKSWNYHTLVTTRLKSY